MKFDLHTIADLDAECNATGIKRNRLINKACDFYLKYIDDERRKACGIDV